MITKIDRRPEVLHLTSEELIKYSSDKIRELSIKLSPLRRRIKKLDEEMEYWINLKYQEQLKIFPIKKIPYGQRKNTKLEAKVVNLIGAVSSMSQKEKQDLIIKLTQGE